MRLVSVLLIAATQTVAIALPFEREPKTIEMGQKIVEATDNKDKDALLGLMAEILKQRADYNANDFGYLISNSAGSLERLATADVSLASSAYAFSRVAREAVVETDIEYAMFAFSRRPWNPEKHPSSKDDWPFAVARLEEADLRLRLWRKIEDAVQALDLAGRPKVTANQLSTDPEELKQYRQQVAAVNHWHALHRGEPPFSELTVGALGSWYRREPVDFDELRGLVEHHMHGSRVTNAWEAIVAELPEQFRRQAAAAYAKPYVPTAWHSLLPPVVQTPRPEAGFPAVAKPSKIRDAFNNRPGQGAGPLGNSGATTPAALSPGSGAGSSGRPGWPWVLLGLAVLVGGWGWVRTRG